MNMCGRFTLFADAIQIADRFYVVNLDQSLVRPRYNIAPSQNIAAIVRDGERQQNRLGMLRWGLIPVWAKDMSIGYKMINARSETVHEKPSYKRLLKKRRCLIPASGFFEWKKVGNRKQPFHIRLKNEELFAFAGLWDQWEYEGEIINSCTIITTKPNDLMKEIHNRMPVILTKENEKIWLDKEIDEPNELQNLLQPFESKQMEAYEVTTEVGSPKNEGSELVEPLNK